MTDVTRILSTIGQGGPESAEQLLPLVYDELRRLAVQRLEHESPGHTLQATALVHEAYLRLVDVENAPVLGRPPPLLRRGGRGDAANLGRRRAAKARRKRGGGLRRVDLVDQAAPTRTPISLLSTRLSIDWRSKTRSRPESSSSASSPVLGTKTSLPPSGLRCTSPARSGRMPAPWLRDALDG